VSKGTGHNPKITIGIPAYRNEKTIRATIESVLAQSYGDLKVVISDDSSPDRTAEVCRLIAGVDRRVTFIQQPNNLNYGNFRYLVNLADTEYFMWLAGDDTIAPDYVKENLKILEAREDVVLSVSRCIFVKDGEEIKASTGTYPLMGSTMENVVRYLANPSDNTRMYGIFRATIARKSFPVGDFHAYDWALSARSLLFGKHYEVPEVMFWRDHTPSLNYVQLAQRDGKGRLLKAFPLAPMSYDLVRDPAFPKGREIILSLASLNLEHHLRYCEHYHPQYARVLAPLKRFWDRRVGWRVEVPGRIS